MLQTCDFKERFNSTYNWLRISIFCGYKREKSFCTLLPEIECSLLTLNQNCDVPDINKIYTKK